MRPARSPRLPAIAETLHPSSLLTLAALLAACAAPVAPSAPPAAAPAPSASPAAVEAAPTATATLIPEPTATTHTATPHVVLLVPAVISARLLDGFTVGGREDIPSPPQVEGSASAATGVGLNNAGLFLRLGLDLAAVHRDPAAKLALLAALAVQARAEVPSLIAFGAASGYPALEAAGQPLRLLAVRQTANLPLTHTTEAGQTQLPLAPDRFLTLLGVDPAGLEMLLLYEQHLDAQGRPLAAPAYHLARARLADVQAAVGEWNAAKGVFEFANGKIYQWTPNGIEPALWAQAAVLERPQPARPEAMLKLDGFTEQWDAAASRWTYVDTSGQVMASWNPQGGEDKKGGIELDPKVQSLDFTEHRSLFTPLPPAEAEKLILAHWAKGIKRLPVPVDITKGGKIGQRAATVRNLCLSDLPEGTLVRHPRRSRWLDECDRLKGGRTD